MIENVKCSVNGQQRRNSFLKKDNEKERWKLYRKGLETKQILNEKTDEMIQKHSEATLKSDLSGCFGLKVRRLLRFLVSKFCVRGISTIGNGPEIRYAIFVLKLKPVDLDRQQTIRTTELSDIQHPDCI